MLDVDTFAHEYQHRPASIMTYMVRLGLLHKEHIER